MENFKVIEEKENPLFNRKEIQFNVQANITPSRIEIGKLISEKFSTQIENIKIKEIHGKFGSKTFKVNTFIYKSEQDKNKLEIKKKKDEKLKETLKEEKPSETPKTSSENDKTEEKVEESKEDSSKNEEQKEVNSNKE
jgi:ribosomal protein S24E